MRNEEFHAWITQVTEHTRPDAIRWCDGGVLEGRSLENRMTEDGTLIRLNMSPEDAERTVWPLFDGAWGSRTREAFLDQFGPRLPEELAREHRALFERLLAFDS